MPTNPVCFIAIDLREISGITPGSEGAASTRVDFSPNRILHIEEGGGDYWLTRNIKKVSLATGTGTISLRPNDVGTAYEVQERGFRGARHGYVVVPDQPTANYGDLVWVSADDLSPIDPPSPVWIAQLAAEVAARTAADSAEATARANADTALNNSKLNTSGLDAANAALVPDDGTATGAALTAKIAALIAAGNFAAASALATEVTNRTNGDTAAKARANHTGTQVAATISDFSTAARAVGDPVYLRRTDSLSTIPTPSYWAHRMGGGPAPEETMEAGRIAVAGGANVLDMDLQPLGDGALGLMHDTTVDRTTDGTGNVSDFTAPAWKALNAAAKLPWNGKTVPPAFFNEVLSEFGGKIPLNVEPKDTTDAGRLMDYADANGLQNSLIVATSSQAVVTAASARGYTTYFYQGGTLSNALITNFSTAITNGADYLGYDGATTPTTSDPFVPALVALGKPVVPYTINRRYRKTQLLALGVAGFLGNEPVYLKATTAQRKVDSWRQGVLGHGFGLKIDGMTNPTISGGVLTYAGGDYFCVGEVSPLANAAGTYSITIDGMFANASGGFAISIAPDDQQYTWVASSGFVPLGYLGYLRSNGFMTLYKGTDSNTFGAVGSSSAQATAAITAGQWVTLKLNVTPTTITLTRTDSGGFTPITLTDSTQRGGYVFIGNSNSVGSLNYRNLAIAP